MTAERDGAESQALALVVNDPQNNADHPDWVGIIMDNRLTAAGWDALPEEIRAEAETAYETYYSRPMPVQDGVT